MMLTYPPYVAASQVAMNGATAAPKIDDTL